ncbi:hypothetical protein [Maribellus sp. YY47]|uniref:alpha-L-rhamnosidase-related protein n=1 Tax=Maribellus sp. YY47 TaxID=2929486 RepID=UPI0020013E82|nr:hypothetical protein [Maribellus sp. YY47]MCK3684730.1 hypothetical protein [Maribellus sp. YY47]
MTKTKQNYLLIISSLILAVGNFSCVQKEKSEDLQSFFQKAEPVWVDSRNVKNEEGEFVLTDTEVKESKQSEENLTVSFRANFKLKNTEDVVLKLAASSRYRVFVNGEFLGHGPCVAGHGSYRVDEYKLDDKLVKGDNLVAIEVAGYNVYSYYQINQPAFLQAEITRDNKVVACTEIGDEIGGFEGTILEQRRQDMPKYSFQRANAEAYQLSPDYHQWTSDATVGYFKPLALEKTEDKKLIRRRVKYPDYTIRKYQEQVNDSIYKFQCNSTGFIGAHVVVETPAKLVFYWDEILNDTGELNPYRMGCKNEITYELEPGSYDLESFEPYTLQFLKVRIEAGDAVVSQPYIRQYVNGDVAEASFACSNEAMNRIYAAAVETFKQNAVDIFMDCPHRERAGWLCDSYFTSRVAHNLSGNTLIETNFLENFLLPDTFAFLPNGMLPMCYPADHANGNYIPNWAMWYVLELEEYAKRSGNNELVTASKQRVADLLEFFKAYENEDGLLEKLDKWVFVEWSKANQFVQDVNYPTNMLYASMLESAAHLYEWPELLEKAESIRKVIRGQAYDGQFFIDNAVRENGKLVLQKNNRTETCQYYAFFMNVATPETYPELWQILVDDFGPERTAKKLFEGIYPANAFIGNYLRLELLSRHGEIAQMVEETVKYFEPMVARTGTLWENIHTRASLNHGFASHVAHAYYRDVLGAKEIDLVDKKINIEFNENDLDWCQGTMPLGDGLLKMSWEKKGDKLIYNYDAPVHYKVFVKNNTGLKLEES